MASNLVAMASNRYGLQPNSFSPLVADVLLVRLPVLGAKLNGRVGRQWHKRNLAEEAKYQDLTKDELWKASNEGKWDKSVMLLS